MDPLTAYYIAMAAYQLFSGVQQADAMRQQGEMNRAIGEMNAKYAEMDAWEAEKYGYTQSARYQSVVDATIGDQRAIMAASDVDVSYGTAKEVQEESKLTGILNQLDIQQSARKKALGIKVEAANMRLAGNLGQSQANMNANATMNAAYGNVISTGVSGYAKSLELGQYKTKKMKTGARDNTGYVTSDDEG